jgi:hypothetical protein
LSADETCWVVDQPELAGDGDPLTHLDVVPLADEMHAAFRVAGPVGGTDDGGPLPGVGGFGDKEGDGDLLAVELPGVIDADAAERERLRVQGHGERRATAGILTEFECRTADPPAITAARYSVMTFLSAKSRMRSRTRSSTSVPAGVLPSWA